MMSDLINNLLNIGITAGLSDREAFVKSISELIQKYQEDPQKAGKVAKAVTTYLEQVRDNINTRESIKKAVSESDFRDNEGVAQLTRAIQELTAELRAMKEKK